MAAPTAEYVASLLPLLVNLKLRMAEPAAVEPPASCTAAATSEVAVALSAMTPAQLATLTQAMVLLLQCGVLSAPAAAATIADGDAAAAPAPVPAPMPRPAAALTVPTTEEEAAPPPFERPPRPAALTVPTTPQGPAPLEMHMLHLEPAGEQAVGPPEEPAAAPPPGEEQEVEAAQKLAAAKEMLASLSKYRRRA